MTARMVSYAGVLLLTSAGGAFAAPPFPTLPTEQDPPARNGPLMIYFEGPPIVANDPLWTLQNTRFQAVFDTRKSSLMWSYPPGTTIWAGNGYPGDSPWPEGGFRPYAGPQDFAKQVVDGLRTLYANVPQWPTDKPKAHAFEFIGVNGMSSPWRDHSNPNDFIPYGGAANRIELPFASAVADGGEDRLISSTNSFKNFGGPQWAPLTSYAKGAVICGGQWRWACISEGTNTSSDFANQPDWGSPVNGIVTDGQLVWQQIGFDLVLISGFDSSANNRVVQPLRKPDDQTLVVASSYLAAGGEPVRFLTEENRPNVRVHLRFGPDLWRSKGRSSNAGRALAHFEAVKAALDAATAEQLPPDIKRSFDHYVEDDESGSDVKDSVAAYNVGNTTNMPEWATQGYWQRNMADPRVGTTLVDGVYAVPDLLARAQSILSGGAPLPDPVPLVSLYSPQATTLRAWQWINQRAIQNVIATQRFIPFRQVFGDVPCGNWNNGVLSGDPAARLVIEPNGGEPSVGIAIDNYGGSDAWGMSIPGMYGGILGDYRGYNSYLTSLAPQWSTEQNWYSYAQTLGYPTSAAPAGYPGVQPVDSSLSFQLGECALTEYAKKVKRNYGYSHIVMPSLDLWYLPPTSDIVVRKWTITRLAQSLARQYKAGLIDRVWAFTPQDTYSGHPELRDAWYSLSKQVYRLTTCPVDYNVSGNVSIDDLFTFMSLWFAGEPEADFNQNGQLSVDDLFSFLSAWFNGC